MVEFIKDTAWLLVVVGLLWGVHRLGFSDGQIASIAVAVLGFYVIRLEQRIAHLERKTRKLGDGH